MITLFIRIRIELLCSSIRKLPPNRANGIAVFESSAVVPNSYSVSSIRRKSTYIVKDMLNNPYNVVYVIFDVLPYNVYICLILGAKCKN